MTELNKKSCFSSTNRNTKSFYQNIKTELHSAEKEIAILIQDTGPGIPRDLLGKVFDPFVTTKKQGEGTGLGLSISYGIIQKLGGRILVVSDEGVGATFKVYMPI